MLSRQLKIFFQVVDSGSFTRAAEKLLVTPASVMKHMNTLERRLGFVLLKRTNQGVAPTAAGRMVYEEGKRLLEESEALLAKVTYLQGK